MMSNYEKMEKMWEEDFFIPLPKCIGQHIADDLELDLVDISRCAWILWWDYEEVLDKDTCPELEPIDGSGEAGSEYRYTPHLWSWFLFWKKIKNKTANDNYLLGEIMWLLIKHPCVDESLYKQNYYKKEKGRKVTTFNEAKQQLRLHKGHPWVKKAQKEHGDIIEITKEGMVLSDSWRELLECSYTFYNPPYSSARRPI